MVEFGIDWRAPDTKYDPRGKGINLHNGLWASACSGNAGTAMIWWWDSYVHPKNLYFQFEPLKKFLEGVPWTAHSWETIKEPSSKRKKWKCEMANSLSLLPVSRPIWQCGCCRGNNHPTAFRRNGNKIRMGNPIDQAAGKPHSIRPEWNKAVQFPEGVNNHISKLPGTSGIGKEEAPGGFVGMRGSPIEAIASFRHLLIYDLCNCSMSLSTWRFASRPLRE